MRIKIQYAHLLTRTGTGMGANPKIVSAVRYSNNPPDILPSDDSDFIGLRFVI